MACRPRPGWVRALLLSAPLVLSACTTLGPDFERPALPSGKADYAMEGERKAAVVRLDPEARTAGPWWRAFGSQALNETVQLALAESPSLAEAQATLARYQAEARATDAERGPEVGSTVNIQRQKFNGKSFGFKPADGSTSPFGGSRTFYLYSIGGLIDYDLDLFGGGRRREEQALARFEQAGHEADAAYLALSGNVALQAMRIAGLRDQIKAVEAIISDDRLLLDLAQKAEGLGSVPRTTVTTVAAQLAEDEAVLPDLKRQYDVARHQLALLVGKPPADWTPPEFDLTQMTIPDQAPVSLPSTLVRRRPDILAAEAELHAATAAIGVRLADQYPNLQLSPTGAVSALSPGAVFATDATGYNALIGLTAPIYDGGARKARTRAARAEAQAALARYRRTVLSAFTEVSNAMAALRTDEEELAALTQAVAHTERVSDDTLAAARLGARTAGDVVQARRQWHLDRRSIAEARAQQLSDLVALYAASAADWREPQASGAGDGLRPGR